MRSISSLLIAAAVAALPDSLSAQADQRPPDLSGAYSASVSDARSGSEAKVELKRTRHLTVAMAETSREVDLYRVKWKDARGEIYGVGALIGSTFYLAYSDDKRFTLEFYRPWTMSEGEQEVEARIKALEAKSYDSYVKDRPWYSDLDPNSAWSILWFHYDESFGVGGATRKTWAADHRFRLHQVDEDFEWELGGKKRYWTEAGDLTVEAVESYFHTRFQVRKDYWYTGVAMPGRAGTYVGASGGEDTIGIAIYRFTSEGLKGDWASRGDAWRGTTALVPSEEVRKKAGALFVD